MVLVIEFILLVLAFWVNRKTWYKRKLHYTQETIELFDLSPGDYLKKYWEVLGFGEDPRKKRRGIRNSFKEN